MRRLFLFLGFALIAIALFGAGALTAWQLVNTNEGQIAASPMAGPMHRMVATDGSAMPPAECTAQHAAMHGEGMMGSGMMGSGMMGSGMMGSGMMGDMMHQDMQPGSCPFHPTSPADE